MKKIALVLAVLLALTGAAFADGPTISGYFYGEVTMYNSADGTAWGPAWGQTTDGPYNSLTLSWSSDVMGFSTTAFHGVADDVTVLEDSVSIRDWNVWATMLDGMVKTSFGQIRNGDYRITTFAGGGGMMDRLAGAGVLAQVMPVEGLSAGVFVPVAFDGTTVAADAYQGIDFAASYAVPELLTAYIGAALPADALKFWAGADVVAVENLDARLVYTYDKAAASNDVNVSVGYAMDALYAAEDFNLTIDSALAWSSYTYVEYALDAVLLTAEFSIDDTNAIGVYPGVAYTFDNGKVGARFDIDVDSAGNMTWGIPLVYELFF